MTLLSFAQHLGLFTEQEIEDSGLILEDYLATCIRGMPADFHFEDAWSLFSPTRFSASRSLEKDISDPIYRLLHRIIACTISPRKEGQEKVSRRDLFIMRSFLEEEPRVDLPWHLAKVFQDAVTESVRHPLPLGFLITQLADSLHILTSELTASLTLVTPPMSLIEGIHLRRMMVAHVVRGTVVWGIPPVEAVPQQQVPLEDPEDREAPQAGGEEEMGMETPSILSSDRVLLEQLRADGRRRDYTLSRLEHSMDWMQSSMAGFFTAHATDSGPFIPAPFQPMPRMSQQDQFPPGYDSWEAWYARRQ